MVVLFQYVTPDGRVHIVFYRLIRILLDESAEGHLQAFKQQMEKDGLWEAAKRRLSAVVSDGESAVVRIQGLIYHSAHPTPNIEYFVCLLFEYFFKIRLSN